MHQLNISICMGDNQDVRMWATYLKTYFEETQNSLWLNDVMETWTEATCQLRYNKLQIGTFTLRTGPSVYTGSFPNRQHFLTGLLNTVTCNSSAMSHEHFLVIKHVFLRPRQQLHCLHITLAYFLFTASVREGIWFTSRLCLLKLGEEMWTYRCTSGNI